MANDRNRVPLGAASNVNKTTQNQIDNSIEQAVAGRAGIPGDTGPRGPQGAPGEPGPPGPGGGDVVPLITEYNRTLTGVGGNEDLYMDRLYPYFYSEPDDDYGYASSVVDALKLITSGISTQDTVIRDMYNELDGRIQGVYETLSGALSDLEVRVAALENKGNIPQAPTVVKAVLNLDGSITISWRDDNPWFFEGGWRIYANGILAYQEIDTTIRELTVDEFDEETMFAVSAYNEFGESARTSASAVEPNLPQTPSIFNVGVNTYPPIEFITVEWWALDPEELLNVDGWYFYIDGNLVYNQLNNMPETPGSPYKVQIDTATYSGAEVTMAAYNALGISPQSDPVPVPDQDDA